MALEFVSDVLLPRLLAASVQSLFFVAFAWLLCKALPRLSASARASLWWLVSLQLVVGLLWPSPLALPLLPADAVQQATLVAVNVPLANETTGSTQAIVMPSAASPIDWSWQMALPLAWVLGLAFMLARTLRDYLATRRLLAESRPCRDRSLTHALELAAEAHGLHRMPALRLSALIDSPQLVGPWRPVLLLPVDHAHSMRGDELDMALTHELVHLQRGDLWWGLLPALAQHLFFFNPCAHYAVREYAIAREAACDAAVVAGNRHCAGDYGRLLVRLGVAPRPSAGLASASPTFHVLKRRLLMLQNTASTPRLVALAIVGVVAVLGVLPYRITAAPASPLAKVVPTPVVAPVVALEANELSAVAPVAVVALAVPSLPPPPPPPPKAPMPAPPAAPAPPASRVAPAPPTSPAAPAPPAALTTRGTYTYVDNADQAYVMISGGETFAAGSSQDMREAQRQRRGDEELLWLRKGKARYVVRDQATLRKFSSLHDEISVVGEQQGRLGARQGELGAQQGELGARQAEIAAQVSAIAAREAADAVAASAQGAAVRANAAQRERMAALEAQQRGMGEQMQFLSQRQAALGREQATLGSRQAAISQRTSREASRIMEQAISSGVAQRVSQ